MVLLIATNLLIVLHALSLFFSLYTPLIFDMNGKTVLLFGSLLHYRGQERYDFFTLITLVLSFLSPIARQLHNILISVPWYANLFYLFMVFTPAGGFDHFILFVICIKNKFRAQFCPFLL
jgi:uncharacterized membrane protein YobD (UPF0266 family)